MKKKAAAKSERPAKKRPSKKKTAAKRAPKKKAVEKPKKKTATRKRKPKPIDLTPTANHADDVKKYVQGVIDGKIVSGRLIIAACRRHLADIERAKKNKWPYYFDREAAERAVGFIQCLKHSTGEFAGKHFILELWQKFIVWSLFGWKRRGDDTRRFREAFISLGRGNGKSPLAAAIMLYLLCADQPPEPRAEIKIAATQRGKKEDNGGAMIVFNEAATFVAGNKPLKRSCRVLANSIVFTALNSHIVPLGKDPTTKDGFNLHAYVADELHEWRTKGQIEIWDKLETAMSKRRQPLALVITTAGSDRSSLWRKKYNEAAKIVRGVFDDDAMFVGIWQIDTADDGGPADDPLADDAPEKVFPKANPNLGISVKLDGLKRMAAKAHHDPDKKYNLLRYHMNVIVRSREKLFNMDQWVHCNAAELPDLAGKTCYGGIDLGWRDDLASFYLVFPLKDEQFATLGWSWSCEENPHRQLERDPYATWIDQGKLLITPGDVFDPSALVAKVKACKKKYRIKSIALDMNNARAIELELVNKLGIDVYAFGQSPKKYNEPIRTALETVADRRLITGADGLLQWAASNAVGKRDAAGLVMPDKQWSDDKIDPLVAFLMGFSECLYHRRATKSGYNERGMRSLQGKSE